MVGSRYCFSHDPACADAKHAACRRGGIVSSERKVMPADTEAAQLETPEDVRRFISETVHKVSVGEIDRAVANCRLYGAQMVLKAIDMRDWQRRIEALETAAKARR
jgi:hypothetical protein